MTNRSSPMSIIMWTAFGVAGIIFLFCAFPLWRWGTGPNNQAYVAATAFILGILGAYGTVGGFILTFHQLSKVKDSSDAAKESLKEARGIIAALAASGEIERAKFSLEQALSYTKSKDADGIREAIYSARQCLLKIMHRDVAKLSTYKTDIDSSIKDMAKLAVDIEDFKIDELPKFEPDIRKYVDLVDMLYVKASEA